MSVTVFMILLFAVAVVLIIVANVIKGDGSIPGVLGVICAVYFIGQGLWLMNLSHEKIKCEATDALVTTIQKTDQLGAGVEFIEVYGRKVAIQRTGGGNTEVDVDGKRLLFQSKAYPGDTVFVYRSRPIPLYGVFSYADEFIEVYASPVYCYDRNVLLIRSNADTQIPLK